MGDGPAAKCTQPVQPRFVTAGAEDMPARAYATRVKPDSKHKMQSHASAAGLTCSGGVLQRGSPVPLAGHGAPESCRGWQLVRATAATAVSAGLHQGLGHCMVRHICWNGGGIADGSGNPEALWDGEGAHRGTQCQRTA